MSFRFPDKLAIIEFPEAYDGLEVTVRISPVSMATYFDLHDEMVRLQTLETPKISDWEAWRTLAATWAPEHLVAWTLDAPATAEGLSVQPLEFVMALLPAWDRGVAEVPLPLPRRASGGTPSTTETRPPSSSGRKPSTSSSPSTPATP